MPAEQKAGMRIEAAHGHQAQRAIHVEPRPRRPEQIAGIDQHGRGAFGLQGTVRQCQVEIQPLGQEILDQQIRCGKRRRIRIGEQLQPPGPARSGLRNRKRKDMTARRIVRRQLPGVFHPVGARQNGT